MQERAMKREHALRWMVCGVAVAAALTAVGPMALSQSRAETNAPPIAFDLPKTRFLSTESAEGSLVVHNTTSERLRYDPFGTTIVLREDDGTTVEQRLITSIRLLGGPSPIEPGATRTFTVALPRCTVIEDPCNVHLTLKVNLATGSRSYEVRTQERSYTFVADPRESFVESGSRAAPIVIARAEIEATLQQNDLEITFHYPMMSDGDQIGAILSARHLSDSSGVNMSSDGFDNTRSFNDRDADASIDAALAEIQAKLGSHVTIGPRRYVVSGSALMGAQDMANASVRRAAAEAAPFIDAGGIEDYALLAQSQANVASPQGVRRFAFGGSYIMLDLARATDALASPTRGGVVDVRIASVAAIAMRNAATFPACCSPEFRRAEYVGQAGKDALAIPLRLTATDRTEIYAIAESSRQQSARMGLDAPSVALARAAELSRDLASDLHAVAGQLTLVATYPDVDDGEEKTVVPVGVALAPVGDVDGVWRSIVPSPSPTPERDGIVRFLPVPYASPTATPMPPSPPGLSQGPLTTYTVPIVDRQLETQRSWFADVPVRDVAGGVDCATDVRRAQRASLEKGLSNAVADAHGAGTVLRHLVLVVSFPATIDGDAPCLAPSRLNPVVVHSPVELVFRIR
jgi:hypothetical protein